MAGALIAGIHSRFPSSEIFLSTFTDTGFKEARKIDFVKDVSLLPFDFPFLIRPVIQKIRPDFFLPIESEFWPNLLYELKKIGTITILINGRISEKSFYRYEMVHFFSKSVLSNIDLACMRNKADAERITALGMADSEVVVTGNIKYDRVLSEFEMADPVSLRRTLQPEASEDIIIFGNTRDGEEALLTPIIKDLVDRSGITVIIAPRHIHRINKIEEMLKNEGLSSLKWSELSKEKKRNKPRIVLFDIMGKLFPLYGICTAAFVGGSLLPFGGQNILEPAVFGKPVFFGGHMKNFHEEARVLKESGGGIEVGNAEELGAIILEVLRNPEGADKMGKAASMAVKKESGVLARCLDELNAFY